MGLGLLADEAIGIVLLVIGIGIYVFSVGSRKKGRPITDDNAVVACAFFSTILSFFGMGFIVAGFAG